MSSLLACGPFIRLSDTGLWVAGLVLLLIKPLAYLAFILAFRYRVSRPIPMPFKTALKLMLWRVALGVVVVVVGAVGIMLINDDRVLPLSWVYLYGGRALAWWWVGAGGAGLVGRRLAGWIISGTLINAVCDLAIVGGMFAGWLFPAAAVLGIGIFILILERIGTRASLRARFSEYHCRDCGYDLTGNLSGICSECGTTIAHPESAKPVNVSGL